MTKTSPDAPRPQEDLPPLPGEPGYNPQTMTINGAYVGWYGKPRRQDWQTPDALFRALHEEFRFTLDGAAEGGNALLSVASTPDRPLSWEGHRVFCNPPWSATAQFVELAATADLAVLLVPARTNARWFHRAIALGATVRYFMPRPRFRHATESRKPHDSPVDCLLLIFAARLLETPR